ncbi:MAG: hypothetical protein M0R38_02630 [Bacteroidia bacterium]|nr:hypothetical protein [Bacteroidia bacterium]
MKKTYFFLIILLALISCTVNTKDRIKKGYLPIYANDVEELFIQTAPSKLKNPGKIYIYNNLLFINERGEGIHVLDNTNNKQPVNLAFYKIPGCYDMAVKANTLFANVGFNLIAINIADPINAKYVSMIESKTNNNSNPDVTSSIRNENGEIIFKCPDPDKGMVIGWKLGEIEGEYCTIR